jgi:hypothetical protein
MRRPIPTLMLITDAPGLIGKCRQAVDTSDGLSTTRLCQQSWGIVWGS